jgi:NitT/TauT family transport system substrate-binding protein
LTPFTICQGGILNLLPQVAQESGFFAAEGLAVTINPLGDGKTAMDTFLAGRCDFALVAEPPIVRQSFVRNDFVIIASVLESENATKILARRDKGIRTARDLTGKRVGVRPGTISHFFLDTYLNKHGLRPADVTLQSMELKEMPQALAAGTIDAFSASDVALLQGRALIGDQAVVLSEPGLCYNAANLVTRKEYVARQPAPVQRLLRGLLRAEAEVAAHPDAARALLGRLMKLPEWELADVMRDQHHTVTLAKSLILSLEDHARWLMQTGAVPPGPVPNFLDLIDPAPLRALKPDAVTLGK